jgi:hypothetical protein
LREFTESFRVVLTNATPPGFITATAGVTTVSIRSDDAGFGFLESSLQVDETTGTVSLVVQRGSDAPGEVSVDYAMEADTATAGKDFVSTAGTLKFGEGEMTRSIDVQILNDAEREGAESFRVTLKNPSAGCSLGAIPRETVTIRPSDQGFAFESGPSRTVSEQNTEVEVTVIRGADTEDAVSVDYSAVPSSATPGEDYTPVSGTLHFGRGENRKSFKVPLLRDGMQEGNETFRVLLSNPSPGAFLSAVPELTILIVDDDPGFGFECWGCQVIGVSEAVPAAEITKASLGPLVFPRVRRNKSSGYR